MPSRRPTSSPSPTQITAAPSGDFRQRYDEIEGRRNQLIARLRGLGSAARAHPGYKRALKLLNETFRKSRLAQRLSVLHAAAWLIDILERVTSGL